MKNIYNMAYALSNGVCHAYPYLHHYQQWNKLSQNYFIH